CNRPGWTVPRAVCGSIPASPRNIRRPAVPYANRSRPLLREKSPILSVALGFEVVEVDEPQRSGIDAVSQATGRAGAIGEHMTEMTVRARRPNLGADHRMADVAVLGHRGGVDRLGETRPSGTAVEFVDRGEQRLAGHHVDV